MTIPFEHIEGVTVSGSDVKGLLQGDLKPKGFRPALKLDWANLAEHVVLDKGEGLVRRVLFTPDDATACKTALDPAPTRFRQRHSPGAGCAKDRQPHVGAGWPRGPATKMVELSGLSDPQRPGRSRPGRNQGAARRGAPSGGLGG
jgi:hypothetical protein